MRRIALGADPGTQALGLGVIARNGQSYELPCKPITVRPKGDSEDITEIERRIYQETTALIRAWHPVVMGIENQLGVAAAARANQNRKVNAIRKGALAPSEMGFNAGNDKVIEVVGVLKAAAFAYNVPILLFEPKVLKVAVVGPGGGSAEKTEVKEALCRVLPALRDMRVSLNATDALAAAFQAERVSFRDLARVG